MILPEENFENFYSGYWNWSFKKKKSKKKNPAAFSIPEFIFVNIKRNFNYFLFPVLKILSYAIVFGLID